MIDIGSKFTSWDSGKNIFVYYITLGWQGIRTETNVMKYNSFFPSTWSLLRKRITKGHGGRENSFQVHTQKVLHTRQLEHTCQHQSLNSIKCTDMNLFMAVEKFKVLCCMMCLTYPNKLKRVNSSPIGLCWNTSQIKVHYCCFGSSRKPCAAYPKAQYCIWRNSRCFVPVLDQQRNRRTLISSSFYALDLSNVFMSFTPVSFSVSLRYL